MKIAIVGCGAMGSVFASFFAQHHEVHVLRRSFKAVHALQREGLRLSGFSGDRVTWPHATTEPANVGPCDMVVLAVKAYHVPLAITSLPKLIGPKTMVVTMQNGLGSPERVADIVGPERTVVGVAENFGASMKSANHAHHNNMRLIRLGPFQGEITPALEELGNLWREVGFKVAIYPDVNKLVWEKLLCNTAFSGSSALTGLTIGEIMNNPHARSIAMGCAMETWTVGKALGIPFSFPNPNVYVADFAASMPHARPSMLQDFEAGRPTEVEAIHGAVAKAGISQEIATPFNRIVCSLIQAREH